MRGLKNSTVLRSALTKNLEKFQGTSLAVPFSGLNRDDLILNILKMSFAFGPLTSDLAIKGNFT